ncbi:hypothetical protein TNCV_2262001 [Trichonephila clavipes]|nr:hypothetical protein TNCV_2262001 [Trichonephila clavipes]
MAVARRTLQINLFLRTSNQSYIRHHGLGGIMFDHRIPLVQFADHYVTRCEKPIVLLLLQGAPNIKFQQDNARSMSLGELLAT